MLVPPKRRWFRSSLRTLFVMVTLVAVWLGWQVRWLEQRDEFQAWLKAQEEFAATHRRDFATSTGEWFPIPGPPRGSWLLWMFGREEVKTLTFTFVVDDRADVPPRRYEALKRAGELFPEAVRVVINVHYNAPRSAAPGA
jgi:hypothetical protein